MREIVTYIQLELGISLCAQSDRSGVGYNTLRRWASGESTPTGQRAAQYLTWALGAVCDPLAYDSGDCLAASIPRGYRVYSAVVGEPGAWRWLVVVRDGLQLHRYQIGDSSVPSLVVLREQLLQLVSSWCLPPRASDEPPAPRVRGGGLHARYWSASGEVTAATIRLLIMGDLARRGDLDPASLEEAAEQIRDRFDQLNDAAGELLAAQGDEVKR